MADIRIPADQAERACAVLALLQWVESARHLAESVNFMATHDQALKDRLAADGVPWGLDWTAAASGCVGQLLQDIESTMLKAVQAAEESQGGGQHG